MIALISRIRRKSKKIRLKSTVVAHASRTQAQDSPSQVEDRCLVGTGAARGEQGDIAGRFGDGKIGQAQVRGKSVASLAPDKQGNPRLVEVRGRSVASPAQVRRQTCTWGAPGLKGTCSAILHDFFGIFRFGSFEFPVSSIKSIFSSI